MDLARHIEPLVHDLDPLERGGRHFLYGQVTETLYMTQPPNLVIVPDGVLLLKGSLCGLNERLHAVLTNRRVEGSARDVARLAHVFEEERAVASGCRDRRV